MGGVTSYFGHPEWEPFAPGLKTLEDALRIRHSVLLAYEQAENEPDRSAHDRLMTVVVVGGAVPGVELAGAFAELARHVLRKDFRNVDPAQARVILLEGGPSILAHWSRRYRPAHSVSSNRCASTFAPAPWSRTSHPNRVELADGG
jgi:NADH:ubiquinone reductase (H+-translocating)